ncbi:MAG TPA: SPOR domain-containing protein [Gammaproteobacteria bacterium]|nr:SPOR domain-containing protein [Gammaproteobacteria bacterium]
MPRDYKHRATGKKRRRKLSPWFGVVSGLLIGLFVAFLVFLKMQTPPEPPAYFQQSVLPPEEETHPDIAAEALPEAADETPQSPPPPPKPRFDFYTLLPEMEVVVPDEEIAPVPTPPARHPAPADKPAATPAPARPAAKATPPAKPASAETYLLQVGSFRNGEQAERFRAKLALLGLETSIQKVTIDNKDTYHRVRVGPFRDTGSLNTARSRLSKQGIESRVIKIKN